MGDRYFIGDSGDTSELSLTPKKLLLGIWGE
jgi:hypothetical protein